MTTYTTKSGHLQRYFTRWITDWKTEGKTASLQVLAWEVCDRSKFDNIRVAKFDTQVEAEAVCKLMNSIEEENNGLSK